MKIKIQFFLLLGLLILSARTGIAQTSTLKINFRSPSAGPSVCKVRTSNNKYEVIVAKSLEPEVEDLRNAGVKIVGNEIIYSFKLSDGAEVVCQNVNNGLEIILSGVVTGGTQTPNPPIPLQTKSAASSLTDTAKEVPKEEAKKEAKKDILDLSVPESPGFTILGLNPQTVVRPASPREFVATIINGIDNNGNFQNGVAIDTAPYLLLANSLRDEETFNSDGTRKTPVLSLADYRKNPNGFNITRVASRIQFSLATTKGTSESDKSARIGTGLHFTVFDYGDPRMDTKFDDCFIKFDDDIERQARIDLNLNPDLVVLPPTLDDADRIEERIQQLLNSGWLERFKKGCVEDSKKRNFARSSFIIGTAGSWISKSGESSKFTYNGAAIWTSLAYGFEGLPMLREKSQLIFHFRRRVRENVADPLNAGKFINKDSNFFGMRLRVGSPRWTGNLEGVYLGEHFAGRKPEDNFQLTFGSDYKLADNLYLNFSIGGKTQKSNISDNKVFVRTSFNWGQSQKPLIE